LKSKVQGGSTPDGGPPPIANVPCAKRGIGRSWKSDAQVASHTSLERRSIKILSKLAATSVMVLNDKRRVPSSLIRSDLYSSPTLGVRDHNLKAICNRIQDCEKMGIDLELEYSISLIQLRIKLEVLVHETGKGTLRNVIKHVVKDSGEVDGCTETQMKRWLAWGSRLADFSGAGEFYYSWNISPGLMKEQRHCMDY
jgi:hypothetical protein